MDTEVIREHALALRDDAWAWAAGRTPWLRLVLLAYLTYAGARYVVDTTYWSHFSWITLLFHEMGHLVFGPFPGSLPILGGSLMQLIVPTVAAIHLWWKQRDYFGFAVGTAWLSYSLCDLSVYIKDAAREELALVGFGPNPDHDWSTLLRRWDLLAWGDELGMLTRLTGHGVWLLSVALGAWLCWAMWKQRDAPPVFDEPNGW